MANQENENNVVVINDQEAATPNNQKESLAKRLVRKARKVIVTVSSSKTGKIVYKGTKGVLIGLGIWKAGDLLFGGKKAKTDDIVVVTAPAFVEEPEETEEVEETEPAEEETVIEEQE